MVMRTRFIALLAIPLALLLALPVAASTGLSKKDKRTLKDAVVVLDALTSAPDKGIPQELLAKADCIMIFPSVDKGAFIVGGRGGRGVASCRQADGKMGSPAFYTVGGASIGFQIGGQSADVVMLIMNEEGCRPPPRGPLHHRRRGHRHGRSGGTHGPGRRRTRRCTRRSCPGPGRAACSSARPSTVRS